MMDVSVILILPEISPHLPLDQQVAKPDKINKSAKNKSLSLDSTWIHCSVNALRAIYSSAQKVNCDASITNLQEKIEAILNPSLQSPMKTSVMYQYLDTRSIFRWCDKVH